MVEIWTEFNKDPSAKAGVITGAGDDAFCAGADLKNLYNEFSPLGSHMNLGMNLWTVLA